MTTRRVILPARLYVRLDHDTDYALVTSSQLIGNVLRHVFLQQVILTAVTVAAIYH